MQTTVRFLLLADLVSQTNDGKLNIMGTFDSLMSAEEPVAHPMMFVVATIEANVAAGFEHSAQLKIVDADGSEILGSPVIPIRFSKPPAQGMPMKANFVVQLAGVVFPRFGDYSVTLWINGVAHDTVTLYVKRRPVP